MPHVTAPTYRSGAESVPASDAAATLEERAIALADPNTTSDRVVTVVGAEPRLAARVLQTANSAAFNSSG
jgi:HD-like signal output (HDOD) protein